MSQRQNLGQNKMITKFKGPISGTLPMLSNNNVSPSCQRTQQK